MENLKQILKKRILNFGPLSISDFILEANLYLGYCGWTSGQLDKEIKSNDWLICNSDKNMIFNKNYDLIWNKMIEEMGLNLSFLSNKSGLA